MARNNGDIYWKGILEDLFADFLHFFYPNADELFDIDRGFEFLDQECEKLFPVGDPEHPKSVDKLIKVFTREGKEEWILVHIEVQGYKGKEDFAERMFTYFYRIRDGFGKRVRSIAIFTDSNRRFHPAEYIYQEEDTSVLFKFKTYKIIDQDPLMLEQSNNPFAVVILTVQLALRKKKLKTEDYFSLTVGLAKRMYRKGFERQKIESLIDFIRMYVNFEKQEINSKFDKAIDALNNKARTMGIREQILQIRADEATVKTTLEKKTAFVKMLLNENIFTVEKIADLADVSLEFVIEEKERLSIK
jgi:hypothetical protein